MKISAPQQLEKPLKLGTHSLARRASMEMRNIKTRARRVMVVRKVAFSNWIHAIPVVLGVVSSNSEDRALEWIEVDESEGSALVALNAMPCLFAPQAFPPRNVPPTMVLPMRFPTLRRLSIALLAQLVPMAMSLAAEIDFDRQVRPILADKCYACHGPDQAQRQADLRLDTQEGALADLGGYAPIVPGQPDKSELVRRIYAEGDEAMPPAEHIKQLSASEKQILFEWIEQGATWQAHWAYLPPKRHPTPGTQNSAWCQNWIDAFVLERLEREGFTPRRKLMPGS